MYKHSSFLGRSHYKLGKFIVLFLFFCFFTTLFLIHSTYAAESSSDYSETVFFGNLKENGQGCGVYAVINLVVDILSIGVGIFGTIGITIVGIKYLTAKDNLNQTEKAKHRMLQIIIGLVAYSLIYVSLQWLLPGGKLNTNQSCSTISDQELAQIKEKERQERNEKAQKDTREKVPIDDDNQNSNIIGTNATTPKELIAQTAEELAWPAGSSDRYQYNYSGGCFSKYTDFYKKGKPTKAYWNALKKVNPQKEYCNQTAIGADCGQFVTTVVRYCGYNMRYGKAESYFLNDNRWETIKKPGKNRTKRVERGDVCIDQGSGFHIWIYLGKGKIAEAQHDGRTFGHISGNNNCGNANYIFRARKFGDAKKLSKWRKIKVN